MIIRTSSVNAITAMPKLLKNKLYNITKPLTIGWMITRFQVSIMNSKLLQLAPNTPCSDLSDSGRLRQ